MAKRRSPDAPSAAGNNQLMTDQSANASPRQEADLHQIQEESERQALPSQDKVFAVARRVRSRLTNLPDPTHPPLGFVAGRGFDVVFPFIRLPELRPALNGDWVQFGSPDLAPNLLYHGDNLQVLRTLPSESIDLIYIDPPFFSGEEYNVVWGDANEVRTFNDIWDGGLDTYLIWLNARLWEMRRVLRSTGSIYVHCDWHASHYIKAEMDKIFGYENHLNDITWQRTGAHNDSSRFGNVTDTILLYAKGDNWTYNRQHEPYDEAYIKERYHYQDPDGRLFWPNQMTGPGQGPARRFRGRLVEPPRGRHWSYTQDDLDRLDREERIYYSEKGYPYIKNYLHEQSGRAVQNLWNDIVMTKSGFERIGYPTQKPVALLNRIVQASSQPGDVVADFFCGGGAAIVAAQSLNRRWIGCDISRVAISVTLDRLVKVCEEQSGVKSNYGKPGEAGFQLALPSTREKVSDIRVVYVGVYPMDRFKAVNQAEFERFVLHCFDAHQDTSDEPISGRRTQLEPILVGPADPETPPDPKAVKAFFKVCLRHLQPNARTKARVLAWKFSPQLNEYRKTLLAWISKNLPGKGVAMELDFVPINSQEFRDRIVKKYPDASDNEFFLRFTQPPIIGDIVVRPLGSLRYHFEAVDRYSRTSMDTW